MIDSKQSVTVLVGGDQRPFYLDREKLCSCSSFFLSALTSGFKETEERVVRLPEVDPETFQDFERWLPDQDVSQFEVLDWERLYKFFLLTDYLLVLSIQKPLLRVLDLKRHKSRCTPISLIPAIYEKTLPRSPLRRLWIHWVVNHAGPEIFENDKWVFPEEFLRELVAAQMRHAQNLTNELQEARTRADYAEMMVMRQRRLGS
jgi:hypothetical protein